MIQFNLLPDVKLEYVKAQRMKHLVTVVSVIITAVMIVLVTILFISTQVQKRHLGNLDTDIKQKSEELKNEPDIHKILTVQNQILTINGTNEGAIDGLHEGKPAVERMGGYLSQLTPNEVAISELKVDLAINTMNFSGSAKTIKDVNEFIDTLKFTTFEKEGQELKAFSPVVLTSFTRGQEAGSVLGATYKIDVTFDPGIFDITKQVKLKVPNKVTTRSVQERPSPLFQQNKQEEEQ